MLRTLAIEIFKTLNNQNPGFMGEIFYRSPYVCHKKLLLYLYKVRKQQLWVIKVLKHLVLRYEFRSQKISSR